MDIDFRRIAAKMSNKERRDIEELHLKAWDKLIQIDEAVDVIASCGEGDTELKTTYKNLLKEYKEDLRQLEFAMQRAWGIPEDSNYHTWWMKAEHCTCPKLDNMERFGHGFIIDSGCPVHGGKKCSSK